jgi:hypothetical protein
VFEGSDAPVLNEDFSNFVIVSNLPIAPKEKIDNMMAYLNKICEIKGFTLEKENSYVPLDKEGKQTVGTSFLKLKDEDQARFCSAIFNGL